MKIADKITSKEELRAMMGEPSRNVQNKAIDRLDHHCINFLQKAPMAFLSTAGADGQCDTSPRGDGPGFVHILDDRHFIIPERPGNRRMDSLFNILDNPHAGMLFVIPGLGETLRINGKAFVIKDQEILKEMAVNGKVPALGIMIEVTECFLHCAKAFKRSQLWEPEFWAPKEELPNAPRILADHINLEDVTNETVQASLAVSYTKHLY